MYSVNLKVPRKEITNLKNFTANMPISQKKDVISEEFIKLMDDPKIIETLRKLAAE